MIIEQKKCLLVYHSSNSVDRLITTHSRIKLCDRRLESDDPFLEMVQLWVIEFEALRK